jgi:hypothetical protein
MGNRWYLKKKFADLEKPSQTHTMTSTSRLAFGKTF